MSQLKQSSREREFSPLLPFCSIQAFSGLDDATHVGEDNLLYSVY